MKKYVFLLAVAGLLFSCQKGPKFEIDARISGWGEDGKPVYLERLALSGISVLDSVQPASGGVFQLQVLSPEYPELYRLRLGKKTFVFTVDSTEKIVLTGSARQFQYLDCAEHEKTKKITELRRSLAENTLDAHKRFARELILQDPRSTVAYYALFQQKDGGWVFDPYEPEDRPYFSAVATAWHAFMPENERSKALYNLVSDAIHTERQQYNRQVIQQFIEQSESAFLEIELPDENGNIRRLSSLQGGVFVLDFSAVGMEQAGAYIFELRDLYNRFHPKGLQIYSVSADGNRLLWEDTAHNLPWITVRGELGVAEQAFRIYNVQQLPTLFLFDKNGQIVGRYADFAKLMSDIELCLR